MESAAGSSEDPPREIRKQKGKREIRTGGSDNPQALAPTEKNVTKSGTGNPIPERAKSAARQGTRRKSEEVEDVAWVPRTHVAKETRLQRPETT